MQLDTDDLATMDITAIQAALKATTDERTRQQLIVNAPFEYKVATALLFLGIVVLLKVDDDGQNISRIALSNTELAQNTTEVSYVPFNEIKIPLDHPENIISTAIRTGEPQDTIDWKFLFEPALTPEQARINQASGGIAYSAVYPLVGVGKGAAMIFSYYQYMQHIGSSQHEFMKRYSQLVASVLATD
ncbi:MAG: hypothetical protein QFB87_01540 [Patescibacteria group bacterium]|nr:hypothetical protein [Patescibacteria group bacterium]